MLVLVAAQADAHRAMPRLPAAARSCRTAPTWDAVQSCLGKLGDVTIERVLPRARLVRVTRAGEAPFDFGLSLYIESEGKWHLGGTYEPRGKDYGLFEAAPITVGKHAGYRIDVGEITHTPMFVDGVTQVQSTFAFRRALLCAGDSWNCNEVITACDVYVHGAARWTFHGTLSIADNQIHVTGDRGASEPFCDTPETTFLGWSQ